MKLAVSNIAWIPEEEPIIADRLQELGVKYIELAPTKYWQDPTIVSEAEARQKVVWWQQYGITPVAFQSMLFNRPDLKLFDSAELREEAAVYMEKFIALAGAMGVSRMVFGSPKNRQRGDMSSVQAMEIAAEYFGRLAKAASACNTEVCIEPNAPQYTCDFITNAHEGLEFVKNLNAKGVGLHLDTACMTLAGDDIEQSIIAAGDALHHFHVSAPMLGDVRADDGVDHAAAARGLAQIAYDGVVSIEMRPGESGKNLQRVEEAVQFVRSVYAA